MGIETLKITFITAGSSVIKETRVNRMKIFFFTCNTDKTIEIVLYKLQQIATSK